MRACVCCFRVRIGQFSHRLREKLHSPHISPKMCWQLKQIRCMLFAGQRPKHFKSRFGVFLVFQKWKCSFLSVLQLCACEEGVYIPWPQLRFPSMVPRICSVLTVLKVNKNHLLPLYRYLEVLNKAKCASVGRSNCIKRVNGTGSFISTLPMHSGSEKVSMCRHVGLIWQLRAAVCPIRCSFVVVSRSSAQRVKQRPPRTP